MPKGAPNFTSRSSALSLDFCHMESMPEPGRVKRASWGSRGALVGDAVEKRQVELGDHSSEFVNLF